MQFSDLKFTETKIPKGIQAKVKFGEHSLSVVKNEMSYGNKSGLYEIAAFKGKEQVVLPDITEEEDTVKGFLTEQEVSVILLKMSTITQTNGTQ